MRPEFRGVILERNTKTNTNQLILTVVLAVMSVIGFASMGVDKAKAKAGKWRIKEATLFIIALCFGGVGSTLGMYVFRHKTQHWYFKFGFPLIAVIVIVAYVLLFKTLL